MLESHTPRKMAKNVQKNVRKFLSCKNVQIDGDEHFSGHFFQSWNEIANTQKIAGWYEVYIRGISEPNEKQKKRAVRIDVKYRFQH